MDTPTSTTIDHEIARLSAREHVLRFLSLAASDPAARRFEDFLDPDFQDLACAAARHLAADQASQPAQLAPGEVSPENLDLAPLVEAANVPRPQLVEDYTQVFGLVVSKECPPYEVQYCPQTFSVFRSQHLADIAGFYHAFGVAPGRDAPERVDHLACELEFLAWLVAKERHALAGIRGPRVFFLAPWPCCPGRFRRRGLRSRWLAGGRCGAPRWGPSAARGGPPPPIAWPRLRRRRRLVAWPGLFGSTRPRVAP